MGFHLSEALFSMATKTKKKKMLQGSIAIVEWVDACSQDEWKPSSEIDLAPEYIVSCGIVFEHTDEKITLALNHDPTNDSFSCLMTIPTGMIVKLKEIKHEKTKTI